MDKTEKIKEWVKKQKKETLARNSIGVITGRAIFVDANELLSFLDTISEEPDKSLEEAAYNYSFDSRPSIYGQVDVIDAFIAGAEWQKEQMLKDAVEHYVIGEIAGSPVGPVIVHYDDNLTIGDKVRVIVLKAEEE